MVRALCLLICCLLISACNLTDENPPLDGRQPSTGNVNNTTPNCTPAEEICDNLDNDCDGQIDEGCDDDDDGFCDNAFVIIGTPDTCTNGGGDCNDEDAADNPRDTPSLVYIDRDGDGYGTIEDSGTHACSVPPMRASQPGDCRDDVEQINPGAAELCDNLDNNCDEQVDEGCDDDNDDYCDASFEFGLNLEGNAPIICPLGGGDCNDDDDSVSPGGVEICDSLDNDCDEQIDNGCDVDGDGYCAVGAIADGDTATGCPMGGGDCDDNDFARNPGAMEVCGLDDLNCDDTLAAPSLALFGIVEEGSLGATGSALATDGAGNFGLAWVNSTGARHTAAAAVFDASGAYKSTIGNLSTPEHAVTDLAITWEETSQTFAVAYIANDAERRQKSIFVVRFNSTGAPTGLPLFVGPASSNIYLAATDGKLVLFYDVENAAGNNDVMHASVDVTTSAVSTPKTVFPDESFNAFSIAQAPSANGHTGGVYYFARRSPSGTQYQSAVVYGDDGSMLRALQGSEFPGGSNSASKVTIKVVDGTPFLLWLEPALIPFHRLDAAQLNASGFPIADRFTVLNQLSASSDYEVMDEDGASMSVFFERNGTVDQQRFSVTPTPGSPWAQDGLRFGTPLTNLPGSPGSPVFFASPMDGSIVHLSQVNRAPNFFTWYNFRGDGSVISTVAPVLARVDPTQVQVRDILYDEANETWQILYSLADAQKHGIYEYTFAQGLAELTSFPTSPQPCQAAFDAQGNMVCVEIATESDNCDGFTYNAFSFQGMRWRTEQFAALGTLFSPDCGPPLVGGDFLMTPNGNFSVPVPFETDAGLLLFSLPRRKGVGGSVPNRQISAFFKQQNGTESSALIAKNDTPNEMFSDFHAFDTGKNIHFFAVRGEQADGLLAKPTSLQVVYGKVAKLSGAVTPASAMRSSLTPGTSLQLFKGADLRDDTGGWLLFRVATGGRIQLRALRVDDANGPGTSIAIADVPNTGNALFGNAAIIDGQLVVAHLEREVPDGTSRFEISRYNSDGTEAAPSYVLETEEFDRKLESAQFVGSSDYLVVSMSGNFGTGTLVLDAMNNVLASDLIAHAGVDYDGSTLISSGLALYPFFDGEFMSLLANDLAQGALVLSEGQCVQP